MYYGEGSTATHIHVTVAYTVDYLPVRIIDLGQTDYRPPQNSNCACSIRLFGGVSRVDLDLTSTSYGLHAIALRHLLPNEYVYRTNGLHRSRHKKLEA